MTEKDNEVVTASMSFPLGSDQDDKVEMTLPRALTEREKAGLRLVQAAQLFAISVLQAAMRPLSAMADINDLSFRRGDGKIDLSSLDAGSHDTTNRLLFDAAREFAKLDRDHESARATSANSPSDQVGPAAMTYADLKAQLDALSPDQLAMDVVWSGDERGGTITSLWIADEDWIDNGDGDCEPRSVVAEEHPDVAAVATPIIPKGTPQLLVD